MRLEVRGNLGRFAAALDLHADEDVRGLRIGDPVVELGDVAVADERAEALEAAALLGDRNREHGFARFTHFRALGDEAHPVEVHVRAGRDRDERLVLDAFAFRVELRARDRERAGRSSTLRVS